ncbi:MAG: 5'/3'-nucleotidase SurE [Bacteroidetes bacterium]|nr:5'/3'-nucleotidase SurE [Bacteroidota bacterium]
MKTITKPLILVTNDDGLHAKGMAACIEVAREFGDVVVVTTYESQSGMSHAITIKTPLRIRKIREEDGLSVYLTNGTPVDCIKLSINTLLERKPDLVLSGINHGSNSSISLIYSGTLGGAVEACFYGIPAVGLSVDSFSPDADFTAAVHYGKQIVRKVMENGLPEHTCLNVNLPDLAIDKIRGVRICRQTKGAWKEEFEKRTDPHDADYYWLTGSFENFEPDAEDTDIWAMNNGYVAVVPIQIDMTHYSLMNKMKNWKFDGQV